MNSKHDTENNKLYPMIGKLMQHNSVSILQQLILKFEAGAAIDGYDHKTIQLINDNAHSSELRAAVLAYIQNSAGLTSDIRQELGLVPARPATAPIGFSSGMRGLQGGSENGDKEAPQPPRP